MNILKREMTELVALAGEDFESPEQFITALVGKLDELRGERTLQHAFIKIAGVWTVAGAYSTPGQARKAIEKCALGPGNVVPGRTAEGWARHLEELKKPAPVKGDFALVKEDALRFGAKRGGW